MTRVVGRLPGVTGLSDRSSSFLRLKTRPNTKVASETTIFPTLLSPVLSVQRINRTKASTTFSAARRSNFSPPTESRKVTEKMMAPLSYFFNCDGEYDSSHFYGKRGNQTVIALTSDDVAAKASPGTIVAAECCYGAQLFAPVSARGKLPIANAYLNAGAIAFFGSTTVAYGSLEGNGTADLITQYFLIDVLMGASIGRSCLQARQRFVSSQKMENPVNLKTLAQFILLGDPSLHPIRDVGKADISSEHVDPREARSTRRVALVASGKAALGCSGFPDKKITDRKAKLHRLARKFATQQRFKAGPDALQLMRSPVEVTMRARCERGT